MWKEVPGLELGSTEPPDQIRGEEGLQEKDESDGFGSMQKITDSHIRNAEAFRKNNNLVICAWILGKRKK